MGATSALKIDKVQTVGGSQVMTLGSGGAITFDGSNDYIYSWTDYVSSSPYRYTEITISLWVNLHTCLLYTSPSPRDKRQSRMPSSA